MSNNIEFVIHGTTHEEYYFQTYQSTGRKLPDDAERIFQIWVKFRRCAGYLVLAGVGGIIASAVIGMSLTGAALLVASLALTIFGIKRGRIPGEQIILWRNANTAPTPAPQPSLVQAISESHEKTMQGCLKYYETLIIPNDNHAQFLKEFFEKENPLFEKIYSAGYTPELHQVCKVFRSLKLSYDNFLTYVRVAKYEEESKFQLQKPEFHIKATSIIEHFKNDYDHIVKLKVLTDRLNYPKLDAIRDYIIESIQATSEHYQSQVTDSYLKYMDDVFVVERKNYEKMLFNKVVEFIEAFKKKDFPSCAKMDVAMEDFKLSTRWKSPTFPPLPQPRQIPYDSKKLPGVTAEEYQQYP